MELKWNYGGEFLDASLWYAGGKRSYIITRDHRDRCYYASTKTHANALRPFKTKRIDFGKLRTWREATTKCQEFENGAQ